MEKRLGRGLGSLLPARPESGAAPSMVPVASVRANRFQPRRHFDEEALAELRESIRTHGVLQPIAVRRDGEEFEIIAGERRWRAAREAGLTHIPAVVRESATDAQMLELALVENVQREDLDPIERASGYRRMVDELGLTQDGVAQRVGLKRATVTNHLRLLDLSDQIQRMVARSALSMGHARALLGLADPAERSRLADVIVQQGLSVRQVEERVRVLNGATKPQTLLDQERDELDGEHRLAPRGSTDHADPSPWVRTVEESLRRALGARVAVRSGSKGGGQIVIDYADRQDLDRLIELLAPKEML